MLIFENKLYIRKEKNGITVFNKDDYLYNFYENIDYKYIEKIEKYNDIVLFLKNNQEKINKNIKYSAPFRVNWLISETCNLDCIYCFADDKMYNNKNKMSILQTAKHILDLNTITVGITGGEPMLNPYFYDVIEFLQDKCAICVDTNGTIPFQDRMIEKFKLANVFIRITIDSFDNSIINTVRPSKNKEFNQIKNIEMNLIKLKEEGISFMIHTVVTQYNKTELESIAQRLIQFGVKRWHLYGVNYCVKCKNYFEKIKVYNSELKFIYQNLIKKYGKDINISVFYDEEHYNERAVLMINQEGMFYVDTIKNGIIFVGDNPKRPSKEEIRTNLNIDLHCSGYLSENVFNRR